MVFDSLKDSFEKQTYCLANCVSTQKRSMLSYIRRDTVTENFTLGIRDSHFPSTKTNLLRKRKQLRHHSRNLIGCETIRFFLPRATLVQSECRILSLFLKCVSSFQLSHSVEFDRRQTHFLQMCYDAAISNSNSLAGSSRYICKDLLCQETWFSLGNTK